MWNVTQQWLIWLLFRPLVLSFWLLSHILSWFHSKPPLPPVTNTLLLHSASDLARMIRSQKIQSSQVVEAYIARILEVNPIINAVVQYRFEQAVQEAKEVDLNLKNTSKSEEELAKDTPLLGVPITIKESIPVRGMSNNAGVPRRKREATEDAVAVAALRSQGAIPLLVSNTPELCLCWETYNPVTGRTNNPYDPRRTPAGSSGGEGALLGAGASVIGLGSDIGGSGRIPASFCGVFGHRPSSGYISVDGHMPSSEDPLWTSVFVYAPLCRYAEDLPLVLAASIQDKEKLKELRLNDPVDLRSTKFYYIESDTSKMSSAVSPDVKTALHKAISHIERTYQVPVEKIEMEEMKHLSQLCLILMIRMKACHSIFQKNEENLTEWKSVFWQFILWILGLSPHTLHALIYGAMKWYADTYSEEDIRKMEECKDEIKNKLKAYLGDNGVLLLPAFSQPAHLHMQIYYKTVDTSYLAICNLIDLPATACPISLNNAGLPVGIQVAANRGQDRLTLAVAQEFQRAFGGWVPPTGSEITQHKG